MHILTAAFGTSSRPADPETDFPGMPALGALKSSSLYHLNITSIDSYRSAVDQPIRNLPVSRGQDASESSSRDFHFRCRFFLVEPFKVSKTQRLELIESQNDLLQ